MTRRLVLLPLLLLVGCPGALPNGGDGASAGGDATVAGDLSGAAGGCSPRCSGTTPFCNPKNHCVACLKDMDCAIGSYCKVVSDAISTCASGCSDDSRCGGGSIHCCGSQCVDTATDAANCGGCGMPCSAAHARATCVAGACKPAGCDPDWGDCNLDPKDGCETNLLADANNCMACGTKCALPNSYSSCANGCYIGACKWGYDDCNMNMMDGCETPVLADPNNCGGCGKPCTKLPHASSKCVSASCFLDQCDPGWVDCNHDPKDGCEANLMFDPNNCSKCGMACPMNLPGCSNGVCVPCGNDCWSPSGCLTAMGKCIQFTCRAGSAGANFCNTCKGWREVTYQQWMNDGYCADVIAKYRLVEGVNTHCGANGMTCCGASNQCGGGDNAWHFFDGQDNKFVGPCLGCANDVNCKYWDNVDNSAYTRLTVCER